MTEYHKPQANVDFYHEQTFGEEISEQFRLAAPPKKMTALQLEIMDEVFAKITENLQSDIEEKAQELNNLKNNENNKNKALMKAYMAGLLPLVLSYKIGTVQTPQTVMHKVKGLEGYINLHRLCKKLDIDPVLKLKQNTNGRLDMLIHVHVEEAYATNCVKKGASYYPDLYNENRPTVNDIFTSDDKGQYKSFKF